MPRRSSLILVLLTSAVRLRLAKRCATHECLPCARVRVDPFPAPDGRLFVRLCRPKATAPRSRAWARRRRYLPTPTNGYHCPRLHLWYPRRPKHRVHQTRPERGPWRAGRIASAGPGGAEFHSRGRRSRADTRARLLRPSA
jgi:hypothetical protein